MKPKLILRIAAIVMLLHTMGHTMGALTWKQAPNAAINIVVQMMQSEHFDFMGRSVSFGLFYNGYGISMIFVLLMVSVFLWLLSADTGPLAIRLLRVLTVFLFAFAVTEFIYFFAFAASFSLIAALLSATALFATRNKT